jgi:hypothetical protein
LSAERIAAAVAAATVLLFAAPPAPAAAANGCGPAGLGAAVPDRPLGFDFRAACDGHDACYVTPWHWLAASPDAARLDCDLAFAADMRDACLAADGEQARRVEVCLRLAAGYHGVVRSWLGALAYRRAQP